MNIFWISGKCGYGKTAFADSVIRTFEKENKSTYKLEGKDFVDLLAKGAKNHFPTNIIVNYFRNYDLLVLDDIDYALMGKPATQGLVKEIIEKITQDNKTKVILISQKRAKETRNLRFSSDCCQYIQLKNLSSDFKTQLVEEWLEKENFVIPKNKIKEIVNKSDNLFRLKGLLLKTKSFKLSSG